MSDEAPKRNRSLWLVSLLLLLSAAALWGSSRLVWVASARDAGVRGIVLDQRTGAEEASAVVPLALLALAGVAAMIATGGWPRRVFGAVLAVAGLAACWTAVNGVRFGGFPDGAPVAEIYAGRALALAGGILMVAAGLAGFKGAGRMPRLGARYSAPGAKRTVRDPDTELWESLSDGEDPTASR
ncbi:Trp biosynthesis-associated membrane protein [Amycolatopsis sp. CA-230715]|uniref:Trp biosynthesis-associated membrane protein n=1 Tax=Amycolatopsis sp. CA-230715 TaxID=2745196 RepID=UPI001C32CB01|nr:Trp biosynthesis-associated membrane protein [Amycolatopsis sp. CA-230715]QWF83172.1 hypothetical protein HUW46_06612 [Amycolatopsis sp. CA-230715]